MGVPSHYSHPATLLTEPYCFLFLGLIATQTRVPLRSSCCDLRLLKAINPLNAELIPICHPLALLGAHHILHVSRVRFKLVYMRISWNMLICLSKSFVCCSEGEQT
jgi:hypothetical protein